MKAAIVRKLAYSLGKQPEVAKPHDWFAAAALAVRDRIVDSWHKDTKYSYDSGRKRAYYLSLEFLIGRTLADAMNNLGLLDEMREALTELGIDLGQIEGLEPDAALGNGGLGRLAACYLESMASVGVAALGYGIRYDHGLFRQKIVDGQQVETPEDWLTFRNPWEFERREAAYEVGFGGSTRQKDGGRAAVWTHGETVFAVAYDTPVVGWRGAGTSTLRLWRAQPVHPLHLDAFNSGDHIGAQRESARAESISMVLYPADSTPAGQELRLRQEYFFVSASLQDIVRRHLQQFGDLRKLPSKAAIQLNDTHPALAVAELMRILVDSHNMDWKEAWALTRATISYTNHTLLAEALETWPVGLMEHVLPRHMQIIYLINADFLDEVHALPEKKRPPLAEVSLIDEGHGRRVRMAHLAFVGSHTVNGVSALHSQLMRETTFRALHKLAPRRIVNVTNGVTPRRWLFGANPALTRIVSDAVGADITADLAALARLKDMSGDSELHRRLREARAANKAKLARLIAVETGIRVAEDAIFDVQVKRIHEYKRQLLNILDAIALYNEMRAEPFRDWAPRVKIFAGKAAPNYVMAKLIIRLINDVARVVNNDMTVRDRLRIVFLPNYNVTLAERLVPAADLSEQISTAGMEASGTGNMKFALNGAITIGTLDGANVEISERVGNDNILIFGLTAAQVAAERAREVDMEAFVRDDANLSDVIGAIASGAFSPGEPGRYAPLVTGLMASDYFMVLRDFAAYRRTQRRVDEIWRRPEDWWRMSIENTAGCGWFSSDRAIGEYARTIWKTPAVRPV